MPPSASGDEPADRDETTDRTSSVRAPAPTRAVAPHGSGRSLPPAIRSFFESRLGYDLGDVRVHTDARATDAARSVNARAYTVGSDIVFDDGEYAPASASGRRLLAHELAHVVQQGGQPLAIQRFGREDESGTTPTTPPETGETLETRLDEVEARYRAMIAKARADGYHVAADNLQHFLDGSGEARILDAGWLRGFGAVTGAERTNQERFEGALTTIARGMADGEIRTHTDYWDRSLTASVTEELYYASGTSTLTSFGSFTLARRGDRVTVEGSVDHRWWDPYDWHAGLGALVPGFGSISDADALLLEEHRGAAPFAMEATWTQALSGNVQLNEGWFDRPSYTWRDP